MDGVSGPGSLRSQCAHRPLYVTVTRPLPQHHNVLLWYAPRALSAKQQTHIHTNSLELETFTESKMSCNIYVYISYYVICYVRLARWYQVLVVHCLQRWFNYNTKIARFVRAQAVAGNFCAICRLTRWKYHFTNVRSACENWIWHFGVQYSRCCLNEMCHVNTFDGLKETVLRTVYLRF